MADAALTDNFQKLHDTLRTRGIAVCLAGIDGCGKTTLSTQLFQAMKFAGIPVRRLHIYQWYLNLCFTPLVILYNRFLGRRVLIFDRTIYDNVVVAAAKSSFVRRRLPKIFGLIRFAYPSFDVRNYLHISYNETKIRRPDTEVNKFRFLQELYSSMRTADRWHEIEGERDNLTYTIEIICTELVRSPISRS